MEAGALKAPPALLERIVQFLIPPAAREAVAGDLREMYSSPRQYAMAALKTLPYIIASQARRNANPPLLGLQGVLLFVCLVSLTPERSLVGAAFPTLLVLTVLLVRDAYEPVKRPAARLAILEAQIVSILVTIYALSKVSLGSGYHGQDRDLFLLFMTVVLPFSMPMLGMLRAALVLYGERRQPFPAAEMALEDMAREYQNFEQHMRRANRLEISILFLSMAAGAGLILYFKPPMASAGWALLCLFALSTAWLLLRGPAPALPEGPDFATLRSFYWHELARQNQIRRFMWWLWFAPAYSVFVTMAAHGIAAGRPMLTVISIIPMVLTGFWIASLNRERGGWVSEKIGALALMRERRTPLHGDVPAH